MSALLKEPNNVTYTDQERLDTLRLIRSENVGPVTFHNLLSYYGNAAKALDAIPELAKRGGKRAIKICGKSAAEEELERIQNYGAELVCFGETRYPEWLAHIPDAPACISVLGNTDIWHDAKIVGMVGARNASANGCAFAKKIAHDLGQHNIITTSGLARGIDTAAHLGSLQTGTVAVIAGGIDNIYPPENDTLYRQIAESGAIIAEAPFGTTPQARHFPGRNRIIAGISSGIIVIEASQKSGSLITANNALDYGRDVFAVPGSPMDPRCKGSNDLLRNGAVMTESAEDVLQHIAQTTNQLCDAKSSDFISAPMAPISDEQCEKARIDILEKLGPEPVLLDELVAQCHITPHILHVILLELELAGRLIRHSGGKVSLRMEIA